MDNIDSAFVWAILSLPPLGMLLVYLFRSRYNELIALHLSVFWAQLCPYGAVWLLSQESIYFPRWLMLALGFELIVYCGVFLLFDRPMHDYARVVSQVALEVRQRMLLLWLTLSGGAYIYIIATYGVLSLIPRADIAESAGLPSYLTYLNGLLAVPAWGAVFCCCVQIAYRRFHPIQLLAVAYVLLHMIVDQNEGKRQVLMVCLVVALFGYRRPMRITWRVVAGGIAATCLLFAIWGWYEGVRRNFQGTMLTGTRYDSAVVMMQALVTTPEDKQGAVDTAMQRNLEQRTAPIWLLEQIMERPNLADGAFIAQSIQNVMPSYLAAKSFKHENDVLRDTLAFPENDYPWTILSEIQAEASVFAAILTPLIYVGLFWLFWIVIARWRGRSEMLLLVAIGIAVFEAGEVQTILSTAWVYLRTLSIYLAGGFVLWHLRQIARKLVPLDLIHNRSRPRISE